MKMQYLRQAKLSLFILGFSLITLAANQLSVLAETRQPTNAELRKLRQELREEIPKLRTYRNRKDAPGNWSDHRKINEIKTQNYFVKAWSRKAPTVATFLGEWNGQEDWLMIYPSRVKNQVCIIYMPGDTQDVKFAVSSVSNNQIRFSLWGRPNVIIKEQEFLGLIYVYTVCQGGKSPGSVGVARRRHRHLTPSVKM